MGFMGVYFHVSLMGHDIHYTGFGSLARTWILTHIHGGNNSRGYLAATRLIAYEAYIKNP